MPHGPVAGFLILVALPVLLRQRWGFWSSMQFNTALLLVLAALGLLALRGAQASVTRATALAIVLVAAATLLQDVFSVDWGIDQLLAKAQFLTQRPAGRMAPASSASLLAIGISLFALTLEVGASTRFFLGLLGAVPLGFGITKVASHALTLQLAWGPESSGHVSFPGAAGLALCGGYLIWLAHRKIKALSPQDVLPFLTTLGLCLASILIWQTLLVERNQGLRALVSAEHRKAVALLRERLVNLARAVGRFSHRLEHLGTSDPKYLALDAGAYLQDFSALRRMGLISADQRVIWSYPPELHSQVAQVDIRKDPSSLALLARADQERRPIVGPVSRLRSGEMGLGVVVSISSPKRPKGHIWATIPINKLTEGLWESDSLDTRILIPSDPKPAEPSSSGPRLSDFLVQDTLVMDLAELQVLATPTVAFLHRNLSSLPHWVLSIGLLLTLLVSFHLRALALQEQALEEGRTRLRAILDLASDGIHVLDDQGNVVEFSQAFATMLGYPTEEAARLNVADWDAVIPKEQLIPTLRSLLHSSSTFETKHRRKDGSVFDAEINARGIELGGKRYLYASSRDVTERRAALDRAQQAEEKALAASKAKSEFLSTMSHEIRTPLNGVIGTAQVLLQTPLSSDQAELARGLESSGRALLEIVNDILDFSKIEAGKMELERIEFDLARTLSDLLRVHSVTASQRGLSLDVRLPTLGRMVLGDPGRIGQVLNNLVSNALKFTAEGEVNVELEILSHGGSESVRLQVSDTGIGIPETARDRIFKSFSQAEQSTSRKYGGTGLGLVICKRIVEMMGGTIGFESRPGKGTTFTVEWLPEWGQDIRLPQRSAKIVCLPMSFGGRILVAEDNLTNQMLIRHQLKALGASVHVVANGRELLQALEEAPYDLVLTDCQMPEMDGLEATRQIRALDRPCKTIPIIALTANTTPEDKRRCEEAGMSGYLSKPVDPNELQATLLKHLRATTAPEMALDAKALAQFEELPDLLVETIDSYFKTGRELVTTIVRGLEAKDWDATSRAAHSLKSSSRALGARELGQLCARIESDCRTSQPGASMTGVAQEIERLFEASVQALSAIKNRRQAA